MSRPLRFLLGGAALLLLALAARSNPAHLAEGRFYSDGATYYSMTWSLVGDRDLEYGPQDLARIRREYPEGPGGIFLKRAFGGITLSGRVPESSPRIYFGKALTYPILAAPFVAVLGSPGFLVFNLLCLLVAWACAFVELRTRTTEGRAVFASFALIVGTVAPLYVFWIQPELFNLASVALALLAWRRDRPMMSALLFGLATYTKPTHVLMAAPLGLAPLLMSERPFGARLLETVRRGALLVATAATLFGVNALVTGEWNYQGGERKTFNGPFPFDRTATGDVTFGNSGEWMTTMKLGPLEQGEKETLGSGIAQSPEELSQMFRANVADFWVGRYAGMLPYFAPAFLALVAFLALGPRTREGWLGVLALLLFAFVSIRILPGPTNWYGGGGTVGNRYFMAALPLAMLFLPRGRELLVGALGLIAAFAFLSPAWARPVEHTLHPALLASRPGSPITWLRAERAMLNDLSFCTDPWRKKQAYDDVEGDPPLHRPGAHHGYWLYFPDDGTFGREVIPGQFFENGDPKEGFRVKRGERTEALLRANEPVDWIDVTFFGDRVGDDVEIGAGAQVERTLVPAVGAVSVRIVPDAPVMYYDSFVYSVRVRSRAKASGASAPSSRAGHTLVRLALHVSPR